MPTDTERLDWLAQQNGAALINDDYGNWAVSWDGAQRVPEGDGPGNIQTTFFIEKGTWRANVRAAIDDWMPKPEEPRARGSRVLTLIVFHPSVPVNDGRTVFTGAEFALDYRVEENGALRIIGWETSEQCGDAFFAPGQWAYVLRSRRLSPSEKKH